MAKFFIFFHLVLRIIHGLSIELSIGCCCCYSFVHSFTLTNISVITLTPSISNFIDMEPIEIFFIKFFILLLNNFQSNTCLTTTNRLTFDRMFKSQFRNFFLTIINSHLCDKKVQIYGHCPCNW